MLTDIQRQALIDAILLVRMSAITTADLDNAYQSATEAEKAGLIASLVGGDDGARNFIMQKFRNSLAATIAADVDAYIAAGTIPVELAAELLTRK